MPASFCAFSCLKFVYLRRKYNIKLKKRIRTAIIGVYRYKRIYNIHYIRISSRGERSSMLNPPSTSSHLEINTALRDLRLRVDEWAELAIDERLALLSQIREDFSLVGQQWVQAEMAAKGLSWGTIGEAEEWIFLAGIFRAMRMLERSLEEISRNGMIQLPYDITIRDGGQVQAQVFPRDRWDRLMFPNVRGWARFEQGVSSREIAELQALSYQEDRKGIALVLGAGNAGMLPMVDLLHRLFIEKQVVAFKPNPVNAHLGPIIQKGLEVLIQRGYLRVLYGTAEEGSFLASHPEVDEIHMTGSHKTYENIVFGPGQEGSTRKAEKIPLNKKPFICELGNISPVIIVPGQWSASDLREQAEQLATWFAANAGFGCLTPRVLVLHEGWPLRSIFLEVLGEILARTATRRAFYPGAREIHEAVLEQHPGAFLYGESDDERLPWTIVRDVNSFNRDDICFTREAFCSLCAETALPAPDTVGFLDRAVDFANNVLWGNLTAMLIVHPQSLRDPVQERAVVRAVDRLNYGTVAVNHFAFASYYMQVLPWGGYPGNTPFDIQSGTGWTANALMLDKIEKSVLWGPFYKRPDPVRVTRKRPQHFARRLAAFEARPSFINFLQLMWQAKEA
jgi:hypothetical protein